MTQVSALGRQTQFVLMAFSYLLVRSLLKEASEMSDTGGQGGGAAGGLKPEVLSDFNRLYIPYWKGCTAPQLQSYRHPVKPDVWTTCCEGVTY